MSENNFSPAVPIHRDTADYSRPYSAEAERTHYNQMAPMASIFSSIQGEGIYVGKPQLFIRFAGCNLRCDYCDTPEGLSLPKYCRVEKKAFASASKQIANPISASLLSKLIRASAKRFPCYHSIALTGGEPLLHAQFLKIFLPAARKTKIPIFLETNGTMPENLEQIIELVDIISMDIKIPRDVGTKETDIWTSSEEFLKLALKKGIHNQRIYLKVVVTGSGHVEDYRKTALLINKFGRDIPIVLQPVSIINKSAKIKTASFKKMTDIYKIFAGMHNNVRIIPQVHRLMNWK